MNIAILSFICLVTCSGVNEVGYTPMSRWSARIWCVALFPSVITCLFMLSLRSLLYLSESGLMVKPRILGYFPGQLSLA